MTKKVCLHHVAMAVQDRAVYERTVRLYRDVLGFPLRRSWSSPPRHITVLDMGNGALEIVYGAEGSSTGVFSHMAVAVSDPSELDTLLERCMKAGCTLTRLVKKMDVVQEDGWPYCFLNAFCLGPAGETLELFCEV